MSLIVDRRNLSFVLHELLDVAQLFAHERFAAHDREIVDATLDLAESMAENRFLPLAAIADAQEPAFIDGRVRTLPEIKTALTEFAEAGMFAASFSEADGGLQLPWVVTQSAMGIFMAANLPVVNYAFLTIAAANLISVFGSENQRSAFLPSMLEGRWFGTMCLSEPQAGSSLGDITTKATPTGDGQYRISGSKMWISGGDHELSENIVHLVLARIDGAPAGVKGISLFLVPRYRLDSEGRPGQWNNIALAGLNNKMGQRATVNCLLNFGEGGDCIGELVGEPNKGLSNMFHMMNEARVGVGQGAVMLALAGYLNSLSYARERLQGRLPDNKDATSAQVPIIQHADVKRMLLMQKSTVEGALALTTFCALLVDQLRLSTDPTEVEELELLLGVLTPVAKSWPAEHCLEANKWAIQVLGGYGYTVDFPVERLYRDNRLNHIHEGTFGIQGRDLLGRKIRLEDGRGLSLLISRIGSTLAEAQRVPALSSEVEALENALGELKGATNAVIHARDQDVALANATLYLDAFGTIVIAWLWLWQGIVAQEALEKSHVHEEDIAFYRGKVAALHYHFRYVLPQVHATLKLVAALDDTCESMRSDYY